MLWSEIIRYIMFLEQKRVECFTAPLMKLSLCNYVSTYPVHMSSTLGT